jgi:hypothetical protein
MITTIKSRRPGRWDPIFRLDGMVAYTREEGKVSTIFQVIDTGGRLTLLENGGVSMNQLRVSLFGWFRRKRKKSFLWKEEQWDFGRLYAAYEVRFAPGMAATANYFPIHNREEVPNIILTIVGMTQPHRVYSNNSVWYFDGASFYDCICNPSIHAKTEK